MERWSADGKGCGGKAQPKGGSVGRCVNLGEVGVAREVERTMNVVKL